MFIYVEDVLCDKEKKNVVVTKSRKAFITVTYCKQHGSLNLRGTIGYSWSGCPPVLPLMLPLFPTVAFSLGFSLPGLVKSIVYLLFILNVRSLPLIWHSTWLLLTNLRFLLLQLLIIIISEGVVAPR